MGLLRCHCRPQQRKKNVQDYLRHPLLKTLRSVPRKGFVKRDMLKATTVHALSADSQAREHFGRSRFDLGRTSYLISISTPHGLPGYSHTGISPKVTQHPLGIIRLGPSQSYGPSINVQNSSHKQLSADPHTRPQSV
jgi:hypothetical protein